MSAVPSPKPSPTSPLSTADLENKNAAPSSKQTIPVIPLASDGRPLTNLSRHPVTAEMVFAPIPNRPYHEAFMRKAIEMAEMALASDETPVGCVFVREGEVIGRGINGTNASLCVSLFDRKFYVFNRRCLS